MNTTVGQMAISLELHSNTRRHTQTHPTSHRMNTTVGQMAISLELQSHKPFPKEELPLTICGAMLVILAGLQVQGG